MTLLNRSPAWQALQAADFIDDAGSRRVPPLKKLWAALRAAVSAGLIDDDYGHQLQWFATVHDSTHNARSPAGNLAWRTAAGKLYWTGQEAYDWAKRIVGRPAPADDELVAATAAALKLPEDGHASD